VSRISEKFGLWMRRRKFLIFEDRLSRGAPTTDSLSGLWTRKGKINQRRKKGQ
jgi:hypothetical protein